MNDKVKWVLIAVGVLFVLSLFGSDDDPAATDTAPVATPSPDPVVPEPEPQPEPEPELTVPPMDLGDDADLDKLWFRCADDDYDACEDLFWDSPLGSEYEAFADERLNELDDAALGDLSDRDIVDELGADLLLDVTWHGLTRVEQDELCDGVDLLGADAAGAIISDGADGLVTPKEASDWLIGKCS